MEPSASREIRRWAAREFVDEVIHGTICERFADAPFKKILWLEMVNLLGLTTTTANLFPGPLKAVTRSKPRLVASILCQPGRINFAYCTMTYARLGKPLAWSGS